MNRPSRRTVVRVTAAVAVAAGVAGGGYAVGHAAGVDSERAAVATPYPLVVPDLPDGVQPLANVSARLGRLFKWTAADGCHQYMRTPQGQVFWIDDDPDHFTAAYSWDVGRRGWPAGGCEANPKGGLPRPVDAPCDTHGEFPCGSDGTYIPFTDFIWADVTGGTVTPVVPGHGPVKEGDK